MVAGKQPTIAFPKRLPCPPGFLLVAACRALGTGEPPPPAPVSRRAPVERWMQVKLNQFMASDTTTFLKRFYYNDEFASVNVVITIGGEWEISPGWTTGGLPYDIAKQLRAALLYAENRFYGKTRPFNDTEVSSLQYLSVPQALADLAQFIQYVKSDVFERGRYKSAKVVLVGCSYAGSLATWMSSKYPHLVDAAFSDSGPLRAQEGFPEYMSVVIRAIRARGGKICLTKIGESMKQLADALASKNQADRLTRMFNTCRPVQSSNPMGVMAFLDTVAFPFKEMVQFGLDIEDACAVFTNTSNLTPLQRLANFVTSRSRGPCKKASYAKIVAEHKDTSYDSEAWRKRVWLYQTCIEFGWFSTITNAHKPYFPAVSLDYFRQLCKDVFSTDINEERLRQGVQRTNTMYGGLNLIPDYVISVVSTHDPWSVLAPNAAHGHSKSPVYVIPGGSHCKIFGGPQDDDSQETKIARKAVLDFMYENVYGMTPLSGATHTEATPVLLGLAAAVQFY
ncbi:unnamed protein product [Chrysodeixis includens]|uniref:Serine protease K12H4.7 n=1 Tax=Chrysodeixis includens TaxID=689277 RepID=A0A9P0BX23_CHRIL|nr:unnamed protein product [Chrysodeixis includens]